MSLKIRMTRGGTHKRPFYSIVVADSRAPRDGRYIEKIGTYNPMLKKDDPNRVTLEAERVQHWVKCGAQPSDRVARFLFNAQLGPKPVYHESPKKSAPKAKAQERLKLAAEAAAKLAEAAAAPAPAPAAAAESAEA